MQEKENKLTKRETVVFVIIFLGVFIISFCLMLYPLDRHAPLWFFSSIGLSVILIFDIIWVLIMRLLFRKYKKVSFFFIFSGLAISTAILSWWIIESLSLFDHMFG